MQEFEKFLEERSQIRSKEDWMSFQKKWLDNRSWPMKSPEQRRFEYNHYDFPKQIKGRLWGYIEFNDDISPECRYEYCWTLSVIGRKFKFPEEIDLPKTRENGFFQYCPFCQISTSEIGKDICPQCSRQLLLNRFAD